MPARYMLPIVAAVFLAAALRRLARDGFRLSAASRGWLLVAAVFAIVSGWLWWAGAAGQSN